MDPKLLVARRTELALLGFRRTCFAIVWSLSDVGTSLRQMVLQLNLYSPQRVNLKLQFHKGFTSRPFWTVGMEYSSAVHQLYFSFVMWTFSGNHDAWVHIWDAQEHDALRRDFEAPSVMDSELGINRLWLFRQKVHLVNVGYDDSNPHGEYVAEIALQEAMDCLEAGTFEIVDSLSEKLRSEFLSPDAQSHYISNVVDVKSVHIPKKLAGLLRQNPHIVAVPDFDVLDAAHVDVSNLKKFDLDDIPVTMAVSNRAQLENAENLPGGLDAAQWIAVNIKSGLSKLVSNLEDDVISEEVPDDCFGSAYLLSQLRDSGWNPTSNQADQMDYPQKPLDVDWSKPVCFLSDEEKRQRAAMLDEEEEPETDAKHGETPIFSGLEDTKEFMEQLKNIPGNPFMDTDRMNLPQALSEDDVRKTQELEGFDDFVEFYAKNYMGYTDKDLASHADVDWSAYNDDSDYESE